jgi:hypothetical protein
MTVAVSVGLLMAVLTIFLAWDPLLGRALKERIFTHFHPMLEGPRTAARLVALLGSVVLAGYAVIFVHEIGHVLGGLWAGFRFHSLAVGPIKLDERFRVSLHRGTLAWSGGWVGMRPTRRDHMLLRAILLQFAGPASSLLWGGAVLLLPFRKGLGSEVFIISSILGGLIELLPIRSGAVAFDGWRIWQLIRNRGWSERSLALMRLTIDLQSGVLPEALLAADLAKVVAFRDDSVDTVTAHGLAYSAAFHRREDAEAGRLLETCLEYSKHAPPALREALMSDAAVFQARRRKSAELAEQWRALLPPTAASWLRIRAEAAIFEARGDKDGASKKLDQYEDAILSLPLPTEAQREMLLRLVRRWKSELHS